MLPTRYQYSILIRGVDEIPEEIKTAIINYEPRLAAATLRIERDKAVDSAELKVRFLVRADLTCHPVHVPVEFIADVIETGKIIVNRRIDIEQSGAQAITDLQSNNDLSGLNGFLQQPGHQADVEVVAVLSQPTAKAVTVTLRVFNARQSTVQIGPDSLWIAFGYERDPIGPRVPAEGLAPFDLLPGQAVNLSVSFPWSGEPFATLGTDGLGINGTYQFAVQFAVGATS